ncbi:hypothetical protein NQZ79_g3519 [Umbelopsis isabellina]|nr:hypothetical protein NQZ79_g3519 [Umbelopsis isabellina]
MGLFSFRSLARKARAHDGSSQVGQIEGCDLTWLYFALFFILSMVSSNTLINPPTLIDTTPDIRYLIVDSPSQSTLPLYIQVFERWNVTQVIRCCEPTYPKEALEDIGIQVHDWTYADGDRPPGHLVSDWLRLIRQIRLEAKEKRQAGSINTIPCIATHCVAGLGREKHTAGEFKDDATIVSIQSRGRGQRRRPSKRVRFASTSTGVTLVESQASGRIQAENYQVLYGSSQLVPAAALPMGIPESGPQLHPIASTLVHTSLQFFFPSSIATKFLHYICNCHIPA